MRDAYIQCLKDRQSLYPIYVLGLASEKLLFPAPFLLAHKNQFGYSRKIP